MRTLAAVLLLGLVLAGCDDEDPGTLAPKDERAVRAYFATFGAGERDTTCVIDELVDSVGAELVAELPRFAETERAHSEEERELGREFGAAMFTCRANPVRTDCFSIWETKASARAAARRAEERGFDRADVGRGSDRHGPVPAVTFSTGKTGKAAAEIRERFVPFVRRLGGRVGHPGDGCLEKPFFD